MDTDLKSNKSDGDVNNSSNLDGYSSVKLKRFIRHLMVASKKLNEINSARSELNKKLSEIKSLEKKPAKVIKSEWSSHINELMEKLDYLVSVEKKVQLKNVNEDKLLERIDKLEKKLEQLTDNFSKKRLDLSGANDISDNSELNNLLSDINKKLVKEDIVAKTNRIKELEEKIIAKVSETSDELKDIELKLLELNKKYSELESSGKHSKDELDVIKNRIDSLKNLLDSRKSNN